ncbi:RNAPII degradation factor [Arachnomyces sp. PD_36]|nr:RNAPII degradation factor [Arachnomyces sp. PD_36]
MSEVQSRPTGSRGRGSTRGGRSGYSSRGGRGGSRVSKTDSQETAATTAFEDEGDIGHLKKKYSESLPMLKELFPDWKDEDIVFALEDADGDMAQAAERITEGNVSQWGEVKKKNTDRSRSKAKDAQPAPAESSTSAIRGGRGRGGFEGRGRARGDRGRGGRGGGRGAVAHTNGTRTEKTPNPAGEWGGPAATPEPGAWETPAAAKTSADWGGPANGDTAAGDAGVNDATNKENVKAEPKSSIIPEGSKGGWAGLFAKPAPPPPQKKVPIPAAPPVEPPAETVVVEEKLAEPVPVPIETPVEEQVVQPPETPQKPPSQPSADVTPSNDELNETNLNRVPDVSIPTTATAASTQDPNSVLGGATPQTRPVSGYAASAYKATAGTGRPANLQRRVMEQQEAVVMPGNHAVDRAAVQFGSMGLNGSAGDASVEQEREEAETRAQPPQHSPVAPRASLPPSTQAQPPMEAAPAARPAPGLPPAPAASAAEASLNDFGRYSEAQKAYDPFGQQVSQPQQQAQEPFSNQAPIHTQATATTGGDYASFYAADQQRNPYQQYYGAYSQAQEAAALQQRIGSGFGVSGADVQPQVATSQPPGRYGHAEAPNSGHNTPNPTLPGQTQQQQVPSQQHMPHGQQQQGAHGASYGYGYPYYSNPHYAASYMNQLGQQHQYGRNRPMFDDARRYEEQQYLPHNNQYGYGGQYGPYGKGGMYGQPQHGYSYEHSSSPANVGGFNQAVPGREAAYGRTGSAQPSESQQTASTSAFAGMPDVFGRAQSGLGFGQNQPMGQQQPVSAEEATKGFETSKAGGPSPSLAQPNRPGSATNSIPGQPQAGQTGLPPMQGQQQPGQQAFGAYPHLNPQQQYGGLGGLGGHHQVAASQSHHQGSGYGNYGGAGFVNNYHGNTARGGGWGGNYGH